MPKGLGEGGPPPDACYGGAPLHLWRDPYTLKHLRQHPSSLYHLGPPQPSSLYQIRRCMEHGRGPLKHLGAPLRQRRGPLHHMGYWLLHLKPIRRHPGKHRAPHERLLGAPSRQESLEPCSPLMWPLLHRLGAPWDEGRCCRKALWG